MDAVFRGHVLYFLDSFRSDEASSLREGLVTMLQRQSHALQQASVHHVGKGVTIQDSMKIRSEAHSALDLAQPSKEDCGCA